MFVCEQVIWIAITVMGSKVFDKELLRCTVGKVSKFLKPLIKSQGTDNSCISILNQWDCRFSSQNSTCLTAAEGCMTWPGAPL